MNTYPFPRTSTSRQQEGYVLPFIPNLEGLPRRQRPDPKLMDQYIQFLGALLRSKGIDMSRPEVQSYVRRMASAGMTCHIGAQVHSEIVSAFQLAL